MCFHWLKLTILHYLGELPDLSIHAVLFNLGVVVLHEILVLRQSRPISEYPILLRLLLHPQLHNFIKSKQFFSLPLVISNQLLVPLLLEHGLAVLGLLDADSL